MNRNNVFESREIDLGNGLTARIDWEYDDDGYSALDYLGEFVSREDEYVIDRVAGVFLGKAVDGFFRISLSHLGLSGKQGLSAKDWDKVYEEIHRRLAKMKVWASNENISDYYHDTNPNLIEVSYDGYELLAGDLGRTCWDSSRYYRYYKPSSNYCPPENADEVRYCIEDWKRMEAFNDGDWCMTGCVVTILADGDVGIGHSSVWGVESDCDEEDRREIERDQLYLALLDAQKNVGRIEAKAKALQKFADKLRSMKPDEAMEMLEEMEVDA